MSLALLLASLPPARQIGRRYGASAGRRFFAGSAAALLLQLGLVSLARWVAASRGSAPARLTPADLVTLSRGGAAATLVGVLVSGVRDRRGFAGWLGWLASIWGAVVGDVVDGRLARRLVPTRFGAALDLETDSCLTLLCAIAGVVWGGLPVYTAVVPLARYLLPFLEWRDGRRAPAVGAPTWWWGAGGPWWGRGTGMAQMAGLLLGLAPFLPSSGRRLARTGLLVAAPLQLLALLQTARHLSRHCPRRPR